MASWTARSRSGEIREILLVRALIGIFLVEWNMNTRNLVLAVALASVLPCAVSASEFFMLGGYANPNPDDRVVLRHRASSDGAAIGVRYFPSDARAGLGLEYRVALFTGPVHRRPIGFNFKGGELHHLALVMRLTSKDNVGPYALLGMGPSYVKGDLSGGILAAAGYAFKVSEQWRVGVEGGARHYILVRSDNGGRDLTVPGAMLFGSRRF